VQYLVRVLRKLLLSWLVDTILQSIKPTRGFAMDELIVFLAGFLCQPRHEPTGRRRKMKSLDAAVAPAAKKTSGKRGRGKKSACTETHTSAKEFASAKPLGRGKRFSAKSSGLSIAEKALLVGIGAAGGKPMCNVNLFGSNSSTSDDESASPRRLQKCAWESVISKQFFELFRGEVCLFRTIITIFLVFA
jgi:hypothetical protein